MDRYMYRHGLNVIYEQNAQLINKLIDFFGSAQKAWEASAKELLTNNFPSKDLIEKSIKARENFNLESSFAEHSKGPVKCTIPDDEHYPPLLKNISDHPPILYYLGEIPSNSFSIALVGSRKHTVYGKEVAFKLSSSLAKQGIVVVSGLARGIDTWSHRGCLAGGGKTVAVLGCGLDECYPSENKGLMKEISQRGAVISEYPLGTKPLPFNFPRRNRIIAGMCRGTVVIEAAKKSGALITAHLSLEYNREVFAVPGSIGSPYSRGCHKLIKEGAKLIENIEDILEEFPEFQMRCSSQQPLSKTEESLNKEEKELLDIIPYSPYHLDQIIKTTGWGAEKLLPLLLELELKGTIKQLPGKYFLRI
ncbi:MAG: DNA-protecting protein DprA [Firmicutes bacterium]|nr:DNA-protecting protein DprA [Bacillota bacterium]